jgi:hypothetical protein
MEYLLYGLAIYCLLIIGRYLIIFQRLLGLTLQYINYDFTAKDQIPVYIRDLFEIPLLELEQLEFKFCCYLNVAQMTYLDASKTWQMLLYNEEFKTFASVDIRSLPESVKLFTINFFTFLEDGVLLQTMNGQAFGVIGTIPNTILQDPYVVETQQQWQVHKTKLEQLTETPQEMSPENL